MPPSLRIDGDEYYIVDEPSIVDQIRTTEAYDYQSQRPNAAKMISVDDWFCRPPPFESPINQQLDVFGRFLKLGNIVALSAEGYVHAISVAIVL